MKTFFSLVWLVVFLGNPTLSEIRKAYPTAAATESSANEFAAKMAGIDTNDDKTLVAYKGASLAMTSKFKKKISEKISRMKEGAKLIELAITAEPNNIEIRMVRLSIQENVPAIVGYKKNIAQDKAFILQHYKEQPEALRDYIKNFMATAKSFSAQEKQAIKS